MGHDIKHCYSSSLLLSAKRGSVRGVAKALAYGADINTFDRTIFDSQFTDGSGYEPPNFERIPTKSTLTALHWAAFFGHADVVAFLLGKGADVNARANMGMQWSTYWSNPDEFPDPLNHGHPQRVMLSPTQDDFASGWSRSHSHDDARYWIGASPLFLALKAVQDTKIESSWRTWVDWGIEPIVETDNSGCRLRIVRMLIDAKASLITRLRSSIHAIHQACAYRDYEVVRFLVCDVGVDVSITDRDGNSALHYMAMHLIYSPLSYGFGLMISHPIERQKLILRLLLNNGLNFDLKNNRGYTAKDMGLDVEDDGDGFVEGREPPYPYRYGKGRRVTKPWQMTGMNGRNFAR
ncbi:Ankyrin repeat and sterile alpha motif domain-containing protein 1B [Colletotrichum siamense]|nr:Ankyrin repeat and sterile alpha motif domain-containing protein 1B [Colletotrichum siamense]